MTRDDVPPGKGQCDIRLQVDNEVEVAVRRDFVNVRTLAGRDARDDGSECNLPLPDRDLVGFNFEVKDSRNEIRLVTEPSRRNDYTAIVHIRDTAGGEGRYHFRLSWQVGGDMRTYNDRPPVGRDDGDRGGPPQFRWNDVVDFRGEGRGMAELNGFTQPVSAAEINIDRRGALTARFRTERGRPLVFTGNVIGGGEGTLRADVVSEDGRQRGQMTLVLGGPGTVRHVNLESGNGRDRLRLNWDRR